MRKKGRAPGGLTWCSLGVCGFVLLGCGDMSQERVQVPLFAAGMSDPDVQVTDELSLSLERAEIAFGPLYLCPGAQAGQLCDSARLEWTDSAIVNGLDDEDHLLGSLSGVSGTVRSWMFDYGVTSLLTREKPLLSPAAQELGGVSFSARGIARVEGLSIPFSVQALVAQGEAAEQGVQVVRKAVSESFERDVTGEEAGLVVRFEPGAWLLDLTPEDFVQNEVCGPGRDVVCEGALQHSCDDDGNTLKTVDCSENEQVCVPDFGCASDVAFDVDSGIARRIGLAMVTGARPQMQWR